MFVFALILVVFAANVVDVSGLPTRKCPRGVDYSKNQFCSAAACSAPHTSYYCCMMTYLRPDGTQFEQCLCPPTVGCIAETKKETDRRSLCDKAIQYRSLNSDPVKKSDQCQFGAVANLTALDGKTVTCNAVMTRAKVGGVEKVTFMTNQLCKKMIDTLANDPDTGLEMQIGQMKKTLKAPFKTVDGPGGSAFIDLPESSLSELNDLSPCESPACPYNPARMTGYVDMGNCKMISYGASDAKTFAYSGMREVDLKMNQGGCASVPDFVQDANTQCFKAKSGKPIFCVGDSGAPVFCWSKSSKEWVLIGVINHQTTCGGSPEVKVIPVPI